MDFIDDMAVLMMIFLTLQYAIVVIMLLNGYAEANNFFHNFQNNKKLFYFDIIPFGPMFLLIAKFMEDFYKLNKVSDRELNQTSLQKRRDLYLQDSIGRTKNEHPNRRAHLRSFRRRA